MYPKKPLATPDGHGFPAKGGEEGGVRAEQNFPRRGKLLRIFGIHVIA